MTPVAAPELTMADSIDPNALRGLAVDALAGYGNGNWPDFVTIAQENPTKYLLDFTVFLVDDGTGGDFEPGDMPAEDAVPYTNERHAAGVKRPVLYASIEGEMVDIVANLNAAGIPLSSVRLLSAHYGAGKHICGPSTCALGSAATTQMDGTQWTDHEDDGSGLGNWDESVLAPDFFDTEPPVPPKKVGKTMISDEFLWHQPAVSGEPGLPDSPAVDIVTQVQVPPAGNLEMVYKTDGAVAPFTLVDWGFPAPGVTFVDNPTLSTEAIVGIFLALRITCGGSDGKLYVNQWIKGAWSGWVIK